VFPAGLVATGVARATRVPVVTTLHGSDLRLASVFPMGTQLLGAVLRSSDAVSAVSGWLARGAEEVVPGLEAAVAPMPVLDSLFTAVDVVAQPRDDDRLLFVGKLSEQKGLGRLLDAMSLMRTRPHLTVVGAGRVEDAPLRARAVSLGLDDRITWLPLLSQAELAAQYRHAAVHVVPALDEGLGLTAVESLLSETPVVGFASGGLPDIIRDGVTGLLVPPDDVGALANALDRLVEDHAQRHGMGRAGRADVAMRFGAAGAAQRYAELYARVRAAATR